MYSTISKIIPAQKITVNLVVFNLVVKMHNGRSRNYYKVGFNFRLEMIRLKLAKFRLNIPIGYGPRPFQLCYQKSDHLDGLCRTRNCRPTGLTEDQQGPALSYLRTEDRFVIPKDHSDQLDPIGPPVIIPVHRKGPIGPVCDLIKQGFSSTFRDSESSTTSKFIYVLRLGITPLMLKSFISSVRLVNSLY